MAPNLIEDLDKSEFCLKGKQCTLDTRSSTAQDGLVLQSDEGNTKASNNAILSLSVTPVGAAFALIHT
jgi:hypothetical protein